MKPNTPQLFIIPDSLIDSVSQEEVDATVAALKELGLYKLPYPVVDVRVSAKNKIHITDTSGSDQSSDIPKFLLEEGISFHERNGKFIADNIDHGMLTFKGISDDPAVLPRTWFHWQGQKWAGEDITPRAYTEERQTLARTWIRDLLITLLSTRNVVKSTKRNGCAALGIGKNKYEYVTTLSLPKELPKLIEGKNQGSARCPHLRRGHIRRQRHGPRNEFIKKVWIEPVFVNADKEWVRTRTAYNVSLTGR